MVQPEQLYSRIKSLKRIVGHIKSEMTQFDKLGLTRDLKELEVIGQELREIIERLVVHRKALL